MQRAGLKEGIMSAAMQVAQQAEVPTLSEIALQLAMVEKRRATLMTMLGCRADEASRALDDEQYQLLMDFVLLQAARKNIDSDTLLLEIQFGFGVEDLRYLPAERLWAVLTFVKSYA